MTVQTIKCALCYQPIEFITDTNEKFAGCVPCRNTDTFEKIKKSVADYGAKFVKKKIELVMQGALTSGNLAQARSDLIRESGCRFYVDLDE